MLAIFNKPQSLLSVVIGNRMFFSFQNPDDRFRRQVDNLDSLSQDGVALPAEGSHREDGRRPAEGLRVYDAWFKDSMGIPKNRRRGGTGNVEGQGSGSPIRPHHRQSASWVEHRRKSKHDLNTHFDQNNIYMDPYPSGDLARGTMGLLTCLTKTGPSRLTWIILQTLIYWKTQGQGEEVWC